MGKGDGKKSGILERASDGLASLGSVLTKVSSALAADEEKCGDKQDLEISLPQSETRRVIDIAGGDISVDGLETVEEVKEAMMRMMMQMQAHHNQLVRELIESKPGMEEIPYKAYERLFQQQGRIWIFSKSLDEFDPTKGGDLHMYMPHFLRKALNWVYELDFFVSGERYHESNVRDVLREYIYGSTLGVSNNIHVFNLPEGTPFPFSIHVFHLRVRSKDLPIAVIPVNEGEITKFIKLSEDDTKRVVEELEQAKSARTWQEICDELLLTMDGQLDDETIGELAVMRSKKRPPFMSRADFHEFIDKLVARVEARSGISRPALDKIYSVMGDFLVRNMIIEERD